jgi:hypothetical protein
VDSERCPTEAQDKTCAFFVFHSLFVTACSTYTLPIAFADRWIKGEVVHIFYGPQGAIERITVKHRNGETEIFTVPHSLLSFAATCPTRDSTAQILPGESRCAVSMFFQDLSFTC